MALRNSTGWRQCLNYSSTLGTAMKHTLAARRYTVLCKPSSNECDAPGTREDLKVVGYF